MRYVVGELHNANGAPGEIRTPDLQLRRLPLYPAELRARSSSVHRQVRPINLRAVDRDMPEMVLAERAVTSSSD
jgi:hypothetical protein